MKKLVLMVVASLFVGIAMAQAPVAEKKDTTRHKSREKMVMRSSMKGKYNPEAVAKQRTDRLVKKYKLDTKQEKELATLCLDMAKKMSKATNSSASYERRKGDRKQCDCNKCSCSKKKHKDGKRDGKGKYAEEQEKSKEQRHQLRAERKIARDEFDAGLQKIMTKKQYTAYHNDRRDDGKGRKKSDNASKKNKTM